MHRTLIRRRRHPTERIATTSLHPKSVSILDEPDASTVEQPFVEGAADVLDPDLRHRLVSETAYRHLTERGYAEGYEGDDWLEAEAEVDHSLVTPTTPRR